VSSLVDKDREGWSRSIWLVLFTLPHHTPAGLDSAIYSTSWWHIKTLKLCIMSACIVQWIITHRPWRHQRQY